MQDEDDRRSRGSRAGRRARGDGPPPADDVLARLGIRAAEEPGPSPWLEQDDDLPPSAPGDFSPGSRDSGGYGTASPRNGRNRDDGARDGAGRSGGAPWSAGLSGWDEQPRNGGYGDERTAFGANSAARNGYGSPNGTANGDGPNGTTHHGAGQNGVGRGAYGSVGSSQNEDGPAEGGRNTYRPAGYGRNGEGLAGDGRTGNSPTEGGRNGNGRNGYRPAGDGRNGEGLAGDGRTGNSPTEGGRNGNGRNGYRPAGDGRSGSDASGQAGSAPVGSGWDGAAGDGYGPTTDAPTGRTQLPGGGGGRREEQPGMAEPPRAGGDVRSGQPRQPDTSDATETTGIRAHGSHRRGTHGTADPAVHTVGVPTGTAGPPNRPPNGVPADTTSTLGLPTGAAGARTRGQDERRSGPTTGPSRRSTGSAAPPTAPAGARGTTPPTAPRSAGRPGTSNAPGAGQPNHTGPSHGTGLHPPLPPHGTGPQPPLPSYGTGPEAPLPPHGTGPQMPPIGTGPQPSLPSHGSGPQAPLPPPGSGPQAPLPPPGTGPLPPLPPHGTDPLPPLPPHGTGPQPPLPPHGTGPQPPLPPYGTGPQPPLGTGPQVPLPPNGSEHAAPTTSTGATRRPADSTTRLRARSGPDTPGRALRTPRGDDTALVPPVGAGPAEDRDDNHDNDDADALADRTRAIDASLTRLTAAHAGVDLDDEDSDEDSDEDAADGDGAPHSRRADRRAATDTPPKPPSRLAVAGRITAAALALLTFLGVALSWGATRWMDSTIRTVAALDPESGVIDAKGQAGDDNVLVLGTASGSSGTPAATGERTDTLMLAHVAAGGDRVVGVSFPMDLEINRPPCPRWDPAAATYLDETVPAETRTALSSAYAVGGPRCLVRTVQQMTGMSVTRFVALDLPGIAGMVDAIGGVDVCVEQPVDDRTLGTVIPKAGTTRLDGAQAVRFAEAASVPTDPSPALGQLQRQQRLLAATFREALSASTLLSPGTTRDFAGALGRSMLADDVGVHEMVRLTSALDRPNADGVTFLPLPVSPVPNTRGNLELRDTESSRLFSALRKDQPLPTTTTPVASSEGPKPADVTVGVVNAAGRDGLGRQVGDALRSLGFGVGEVGNAPKPAAETLLRFSPDRADAAELLGEVVPGARLVQDPGSTGTLQLVLGSSFDGTVRAPVTDTAAPAAQTAPTASCG